MTDSESERSQFLQMVGQCATELERMYQKDFALSTEDLRDMEATLNPLLDQGFFAMTRQVLSPQEYYQGCMTLLLAHLFELAGSRPKDAIASLRSCLECDGKAMGDGYTENNPLLLNLILDRSRSHPGLGLSDWVNVVGLVSTIQSNVAIVNRRLDRKKLWLQKNQHPCPSTAKFHKIAKEALEAIWVIPISYIVGFVVYDATCRQYEDEEASLSWENDIQPKIEAILYSSFPRLRPQKHVDAGLILLQLDLLQEESVSMLHDLNTKHLSSKLQG